MYDFITIWAGGAGLFVNCFLPKKSKKIILEKNNLVGIKVLMSWWERANLTNIDIDAEKDYFSCSKKASIWFLSRWTNYDTINFFETHGVKTKIEDRWRVITASGHARDIVKVLYSNALENETKFSLSTEVLDIKKENDIYIVETDKWVFKTKNLIIATGGKSYPQTWTTGFAYQIAKKFDLDIVLPYKGLVWIVTKQDVSVFSWTTVNVDIQLLQKNKIVYEENWPLLFTHWWLSWPIIFNLVLALWKYINCWNNNLTYLDFELKIVFNLENTTKKLRNYLNLNEENNSLILNIQDLRSWKEAKVTGGGVKVDQLNKYLEVKKHPWLYFIGEVVDITWKTGWFNLQWAWSSAYCCAEKFKDF